MTFIKDPIKDIEWNMQLASDIDETENYIDSGSYIFNALNSSINSGFGNKIIATPESSMGKTSSLSGA